MLKELEKFVKRLVEYLERDVTVILFGSYAKGNYNLASDIDLIVISDKLKGNPMERTKMLYELNTEFLPLDILAYRREEFLRALENLSPSALDAIKEGKVLYDSGFYVTARKFFEELCRKGLKKKRFWMMVDSN